MRKAIAIDFDGCLCTDAFPAVGRPNWPVINRAKAEQRAGAGLILWTCREDQLLLDAMDGILEGPACSCAEDCECPYFTKERERAKTIKAVWHDEGGPCWTFETDIPHEIFTIFEDGEPFCEGIVFSMEEMA